MSKLLRQTRNKMLLDMKSGYFGPTEKSQKPLVFGTSSMPCVRLGYP